MPREEGWYFLQAGKFLERAEKTARALDVKYHLLVADSSEAEVAALAATDGVPGDSAPVAGGAAVALGLRGVSQDLPQRRAARAR